MKTYHIIFDPNHNMGKEYFRVHTSGCRDITLEVMKSENNWRINAETLLDAVKDELEDQDYEIKHVKVCNCCKDNKEISYENALKLIAGESL